MTKISLMEKSSERRKNFPDVFVRFHRRPDLFDFTVRPDEKGHTMRAQVFSSHETFLTPNAVSLDNLFIFIGQKRERQFKLVHELIVRLRRIGADAENDRAL